MRTSTRRRSCSATRRSGGSCWGTRRKRCACWASTSSPTPSIARVSARASIGCGAPFRTIPASRRLSAHAKSRELYQICYSARSGARKNPWRVLGRSAGPSPVVAGAPLDVPHIAGQCVAQERPMRQITCFAAVAVAIILAGCRDNTVQPKAPALDAAIQDGNHAGNPNFFFLPPLVPNPVGSPNFNPGTFNAKLAPVVEVCRLAGNPLLDPSTSCGPLVFGPASMALDATNQLYQLNWDTQASQLDATASYA